MAIPKDILDTAGVVAMDNLLKRAGVTTEQFEKTSQAIKPITQEDVTRSMQQTMPMLQQDPSQRSMSVMPSDPNRIAGVENVKRALDSGSSLDTLAMMRMQQQPTMQAKAGTEGMTMSFGSGPVPGEGHGMQDNVQMPIVEKGNKVATLAVSPDEYIVDAHTMSALGNGSADAGADVMDKVVKEIRQKAFGTTKQPEQINGLASLRSAIG
jgi:hypothetical protein